MHRALDHRLYNPVDEAAFAEKFLSALNDELRAMNTTLG